MKKRILLLLFVLFLVGCSVTEQEAEILVFDQPVSSLYTGKVKQKIPNGEGFAKLEDGTVEGQFENGTFISGSANNIPYQITFHNQEINGNYTGEVMNQFPNGLGTFESNDFSFEGTWIDGKPNGEGKVTASSFYIDSPIEILKGSYIGEINHSLAEGNGTFTYYENEDKIQMTGQFLNNMFNGTLVKTIEYKDTIKSFPVYYEKGHIIQTPASTIAYLEGMRKDSYCLSEAQLSFIKENSSIFEGKENTQIDTTFNYDAFNENDEPQFIVIQNALVKSVQRYKPYTNADTVTSMIVQNHEGWYHLVFAYSVDTVNIDDTVTICALPLCRSTLTAIEQDYPAIDVAGAYILYR